MAFYNVAWLCYFDLRRCRGKRPNKSWSGSTILSLVHRPNSLIATLLATKFLAWAGKLTYGLYLFHILVINFVVLGFDKLHVPSNPHSWLLVAVTSYALSVLVAFGLHEVLEKPAIRFGKTLIFYQIPGIQRV